MQLELDRTLDNVSHSRSSGRPALVPTAGIVILLYFVLLGAFGCGESSPPGPVEFPPADPLPLGITLSGDTLSTADFRGKVILICFWATWCGPCRSAFADLDSVWTDLASLGEVAVVAPALDTIEGALETYLDGQTHGFLITRAGAGLEPFHISGIPAYYVLDALGYTRWHALGYRSPESIEAAVNALLDRASVMRPARLGRTRG